MFYVQIAIENYIGKKIMMPCSVMVTHKALTFEVDSSNLSGASKFLGSNPSGASKFKRK